MNRPFVIVLIYFFIFATPSWAQQVAPDVARAEALVRAGKAADAFALLEPYEFDFAGKLDFDYWYGVAALESARPDKATLALERALAVNPDFVAARLDLARAYFALGDLERARTEFDVVMKQNPPAPARLTVERYLAEIDRRTEVRLTRWSAYLEGTIGRDTNVNNSTSQSSISVPLFGLTFQLAATSIKTPDNYLIGGGGVEVFRTVSDGLGVFAGLDIRQRINQRQDTFDYNKYDGRAGVQYVRDRNTYRMALSYGQYYLDHSYNYENHGFSAEWRRTLDERNVVSVFGLHNRLRFPDSTLQANNVNQPIIGAGWLRALNAEGSTFIQGSAYYGYERDTDSRVDGDRKFWGLRVLGQHGFGEKLAVYASASAQPGDYEKLNFLFQTFRKDRQYDATLGLNYHIDRHWTLRPQVSYTRNQSNIATYDYERYDVSLTLRRDFR
jgi:tetratricopeptide (TPR) repeat protein